MKISTEYELMFPPTKIFLCEQVSWDWDKREWRMNELASYELPEGGGIQFYPKPGFKAFDGFPFPRATQDVASWKRMVMAHVRQIRRNPFLLLFYRSWFKELEEVASVGLFHFYLKPQYYCRPMREMFRILTIVGTPEWLTHCICSVFQWDTVYRFPLQHYVGSMSKHLLMNNPAMEIRNMLAFAENTNTNDRVVASTNTIAHLFVFLWVFSRKFRRIIKRIAEEIRIEEFQLSEDDAAYAYKG